MAGGSGSPVKAILFAFFANLGIAIAKLIAAFFTGSSSMFAEAIHSGADTVNQVLLLVGLRGAKRAPDAEHPLGYGKLTFFWSFIVAMMLFSIGGLFSVYEGWHKLHDPEPLAHAWVALLVLGVSILLEAASMWGCMREVNKIRGQRSILTWLKQSRNSELVVVFGEDLAALIGLVVAFAFVTLATMTGNNAYDAYGSIAIGAILLVISVLLAVRVKALLIGRSADPDITAAIEAHIAGDESVDEVFNVITVQIGPQFMLAAKIKLRSGLGLDDACRRINALERALKGRFPDLAWSFIEPDIDS